MLFGMIKTFMVQSVNNFLFSNYKYNSRQNPFVLKELSAISDCRLIEGELVLKIELAKNDVERSDIYRLRYDIFYEELHKNLSGTDNDSGSLVQPLDKKSDIIYIKDEHSVVGSLRFLTLKDYPFDSFYKMNISRFSRKYKKSQISNSSLLCVEKRYRSMKIPFLFAPFLYDLARKKEIKINIILAPERCVHFYRKFGYHIFEKKSYYKEAQEFVHPLYCDFEDTAFLKEIESPFLLKKRLSLDIKPSTLSRVSSRNYLL